MGKKSGDTVPSGYLDSKFKKVTQEIKHYRYLAQQELVCVYACQHAIADSQGLTEMQQPSEHFVCGSAGCRELLITQQHRRVSNTN